MALVAVVAVAIAGDDEGGDAHQDSKVLDADADAADEAPPFKSKSALCRALQCNEQQDGEIREIVLAYTEAKEVSDAAIREAHTTLEASYSADELDDSAMQLAYTTIATQRADTVQAAHAGLVEMHALLSPEQRAELAAMIARYGPLQPFKVASKKPKKKKPKKKKGQKKQGPKVSGKLGKARAGGDTAVRAKPLPSSTDARAAIKARKDELEAEAEAQEE